jgi:hypothetical protein
LINSTFFVVNILLKNGGGGWIRTNVLVENRFTVCRL